MVAGAAFSAQSASSPQKKADKAAPAKGAVGQTTEAAKPAEKPEPLSPEVAHRIQNEIRTHYNVPQQITISVGTPTAGAVPGYDDLAITLLGGKNPSTHEFLISKDRKTLAHMEKYDVSQDLMSKIDVKGRRSEEHTSELQSRFGI